MWQLFTERARKVVFYAQEAAQEFKEGYVSTEHLLLALVRERDSVAGRVLETLNVNPEIIRSEVERQLPRGDARPNQDMTLTPRAKRVIDLAYDEARHLNNNYIGTEHLLLGLIREGEGLAGRVLARLGVELEKTRKEVIALQGNESDSATAATAETCRVRLRPFPFTQLFPYPDQTEPLEEIGAVCTQMDTGYQITHHPLTNEGPPQANRDVVLETYNLPDIAWALGVRDYLQKLGVMVLIGFPEESSLAPWQEQVMHNITGLPAKAD